MKISTPFLLIFLAMLVTCSKDESPTSDTGSKQGQLNGNVTNHFTLEGVSGAVVAVAGISDVSDANGNYLIENILIGSHTLTAVAGGFDNYSASVAVSEGQWNRHNCELRPTRIHGTGSIFGYAYRSGTSLDEICSVRIYVGSVNNHVTDTSSGPLCMYYICNIPPGWQNFIAAADGYWSYTREVNIQPDSLVWFVFPMDSIR